MYPSPGIFEILIFLVIAVLTFGVPVAIVVLLVMLIRKQSSGDKSVADSGIMTENRRLRDEIAGLKNKQD